MKKTMVAVLAAFATAAFGLSALAATINQVIVRQQWPWSTDVKVEYQLEGVDASHPVDLAVTAYNGDTLLDSSNLRASITGDLYGITEEFGEFYIDPISAFGSERIAMTKFKVKLAVSDSPENLDEVLYKVFCLTNQNDVVDITRRELLNGKYGSYETDFSRIGAGFQTPMSDILIWTAVTNDIKYKTSHLVMRKIPAKDVVWQCGDGDDSTPGRIATSSQYYIKLREDYYAGVFELTQKQYENIYGSNPSAFNSEDDSPIRPAENFAMIMCYGSPADSYNHGRIMSDERVCWPTNTYLHDFCKNLVLDKLYKKTGWEFDIPTEAQWEFACRAGTTGPLYSGKSQTVENTKELGWCSTTSGDDNQTHPVGLLKPNAFGLYDMFGNVAEYTHNSVDGTMASGAAPGSGDGLSADAPIIDPVGAIGAVNRWRRGGSWNWASGSALDCRSGTRLDFWYWYEGRSDHGVRLVCPVSSQWSPHN